MPMSPDRDGADGAGSLDTSAPSNQHNLRFAMGYEPIDLIHTNPRDPRVYKEAERRRIARALRHFGPLPLLVNPGRVVLSGNIWLESARLAGFQQVPVFVVEHLSAEGADAFMLFQVRSIERGEWDGRPLP